MRLASLALVAACGASVSGTVRSSGGLPLEGVTVIAGPDSGGIAPQREGSVTAVTHHAGTYKLDAKPGKWVVTFFYGPLTYHRSIDVTGNTVVDQDIDDTGTGEMTCTGRSACQPTRR